MAGGWRISNEDDLRALRQARHDARTLRTEAAWNHFAAQVAALRAARPPRRRRGRFDLDLAAEEHAARRPDVAAEVTATTDAGAGDRRRRPAALRDRRLTLEAAEAVVALDRGAVHAPAVGRLHPRHRVQHPPVVPDHHVGRLPLVEVARGRARPRRSPRTPRRAARRRRRPRGRRDPSPSTARRAAPSRRSRRVQTAGCSARGRSANSTITASASGDASTSTRSAGRPKRRLSMITSIA